MKLSLDEHLILNYKLIDGKKGMPYLVFLHDGLGCSKTWKEFPRELCSRTGCPGLLYDRAGYGKSSACREPRTIHYLHKHALVELPAVLHSLIEGKPYILVGHSDGGTIALIHAAERSPSLLAVVSEAAHIFVESETLRGINRVCRAYDNGLLQILQHYHGKKAETVFNDWAQTWLSDWFRQWNIEYLLPAINSPLLIIQGVRDEYATSRQVEAIAAATTSSCETLFIEKCGHIPHREQPETVYGKVTTFIGKVINLNC